MKKIVVIVLIVIAVLYLFLPRRGEVSDGGTITYSSPIYEVYDYSEIQDDFEKVKKGTEVKIFGKTIYDATRLEAIIYEN